MSDTIHDIATQQLTAEPLSISRTPIAVKAGGKTVRMTRRTKVAIDSMVWEGLNRREAAERAGLKENSLYVALAKADCRTYYLAQCEVLRTSGRARRIHRLEQMAEQDDNKQAAVNAIRALDYISDEQQQAVSRSASPGFQIVIVNQGAASPPAMRVVEHVEVGVNAQSTPDED